MIRLIASRLPVSRIPAQICAGSSGPMTYNASSRNRELSLTVPIDHRIHHDLCSHKIDQFVGSSRGTQGYQEREKLSAKLSLPPPRVTLASTTLSNMKFDYGSEVAIAKPILTSPILPFGELYFFQKLLFPCTYFLMYYMDFLQGYMPWYLVIGATTLTFRSAMFPLVGRQRAMIIKSHNLMPETQKIYAKMNDARITGDHYEMSIQRTKLKLLEAENGISIKSKLTPIMIQASMFIPMFLLLKSISEYPLESMKTGGCLWFQDLTVADPYYGLPIMTALTTLAVIEFGAESSGPSVMGPTMRWVMRMIPLGILWFTSSYPAGITLFWAISNMITLLMTLILKTPVMKSYFKIPQQLVHAREALPTANQSFKTQFRSAVERGRADKTSIELRRLDDVAFKKAGIGPLKKTYKEPPGSRPRV